VRFAGKAVPKDGYAAEEPSTLRILEASTSDAYRSVVGEWGQVSEAGPYEWSQPPDLSPTPDPADGDDTPQTARPLTSASRSSGRVQAEHDVDWYAFSVPADQNSVRFTVGGRPSVGVKLTLVDEGGASVPMTFEQGDEPGTVIYTAAVTGGAEYRVLVEQPPFSAVVTFDTSGSMGSYLSFVTQALRSYADGVTKGQESIQVVPFEEPPLLADWSDDAYALGNAVASYVPLSGSSSAEAALLNAITLLTGHQGARAILLVTDAETSSYGKSTELWKALAAVRPVIFAVHVGGDVQPRQTQHFMEDWADAAGGFYQYARSHGEIDLAFERMATWLRRPAAYSLSYETSVEHVPPPEPGRLSVVSWPNPDGSPSQPTVGKDVAVETILDTSGSMLTPLSGKRRIEVAKDALAGLLGDALPEGVPMALRIFGDRSEPCGTRLAVPFGPLDIRRVSDLVAGIEVVQEADTPIAGALLRTPDDLAGSSGSRIVLLITDSEETWPHPDLCGHDPADAIRKVRRAGITSVSIIGLAVKDRGATQTMRKWARAGNGTYFAARDLEQLARAVRSAVSAPFAVYDTSGQLVANGVVNAAPVSLPPGSYRVVVSSDPEVTFEAIAVESDDTVTVTMPSAQEPPEPPPSDPSEPAPSAPPGSDPG
jgi:Mg-chelatase subunit ChlD